MKQAILLLLLTVLIFSCSTKKERTLRFEQNVEFGENIYLRDFDEKTGWTRVLLNKPHFWGYIDKDSVVRIPFIFKFLNSFDSVGMAVGQIGDKHGFINTNCDTIVPFMYNSLGVFYNGLARAELNKKNGFINRTGLTIIPFKYDKAHGFIDCGVAQVSENKKWGFIDTTGKEIIPLLYSKVIAHRKDSLLFVSKNGKWAIFNNKGTQLSSFIYNEIYGTYNNFDYFNDKYLFNGLLLVRKGHEYRYLNRNLDIIADFGYYSKAEPITEYGYAFVKRGSYYGIINNKGELVIPFQYDLIEHPRKTYQGYYNEFYIKKGGKIGVLNENAKFITEIIYDNFERDYYLLNDSLKTIFIAKKDAKLGIIDITGKVIFPLEYETINPFKGDSVAIAKKDKKFGLIKSNGNIELPFEYENIFSFKKWDYYILQKDDLFSAIQKHSFKEIFPLEYQGIEQCYYDENRFIVKKNGLYGIITKKQEVIIPIEYDKISNWVEYGPKELFVEKNGKQGLITREGEIVIPPVYDKIFVDNPTIIKVQNNGLYGTINWKNEIVHPIKYENIFWEWPYITGRSIDTIYIEKEGKYFATDIKGKVIMKSVSNRIIDDKFGYFMDSE